MINPFLLERNHNLARCFDHKARMFLASFANLIDLHMQVSTFIEQVVEDESQMEALLQDCSRIMVWNNYLESSNSFYPSKWLMKNNLDAILLLT